MKRLLASALLVSFSMTAGCSPTRDQAPDKAAADKSKNGQVRFNSDKYQLKSQADRNSEFMFYILVGEVAGQRGRYDIAAKSYLKAAMLSKDPRIAQRATAVAVYAKDADSALKAARRWAELQPSNSGPHKFLVTMYVRQKNLNAALPHLETIIRLHKGKKPDGFRVIVGMLVREKDVDTVMKLMAALMSSHQGDASGLYAYAQLAAQHGRYALAEQLLGKALRLKPDWLQARQLYAAVLMKRGKTAEALASIEKLVRLKPNDRKLRIAYASLLADARKYAEARKQFRLLLKQRPNDQEVLYSAALVSIESRRYREAERYLKKLLKGKLDSTARYYLGVVAERRKQYSQAIKWFSSVTRGSNILEAQIRIAVLKGKKGQVEAARQYLYRIPARNSRMQMRLYVVEMEILRNAGRYKDAMGVINHALQKYPEQKDLLYSRAMLAEKMNRLDILEADLKNIIKRYPKNAMALNALGYTLADRTNRYQEALGYILKAYKLSPNEASVIDSLGWVYYRMSRLDEALKYMRKAYAIDPDPEIAAHLGEILWAKGNRQEARRVWNRALKDNPDHKVLLKTIKRFTKK